MSDNLQTWKARQYYKTPRIKNRFMFNSENREVVPRYKGGAYGKRPDKLSMKGDLEHFIDSNAVEFHASVEKWKNPLMIDEVDNPDLLRTGWDLIIDIDCDIDFQLAKDTATLIIDKLEEHGIESVGVKFSGNRGFHLSIKGEAFPDTIREEAYSNLYPELAEKLITFLRHELEEDMKQAVRDNGYTKNMQTQEQGEDPYQVSDIEQGWTSRHLFRMPYSLHSGSGLVSLPIPKDEIQEFEKNQAKISNVIPKHQFFIEPEENEAEQLVEAALTFADENPDKFKSSYDRDSDTEFEAPDQAIPEEMFPPTIKKILEGLDDGRKRGLFILIKFLQCTGWEWKQIREGIHQWNQRNNPSLEEGTIEQQISYHENKGKELPPPNFDARGYYKDMQVYQGEDCANPVSYAFRQKRKKERMNEEPDTGDEENAPYTCQNCGKILWSLDGYENHVETCIGQGL